jgi:hypothetical protein
MAPASPQTPLLPLILKHRSCAAMFCCIDKKSVLQTFYRTNVVAAVLIFDRYLPGISFSINHRTLTNNLHKILLV